MQLQFDPSKPITSDDITVELKPHKGIKQSRYGWVESTLDQDVVFVNGVWSGYVGHKPGSPICLIFPDLPEIVLKTVKEKVDAIRGNVSVAVNGAFTLEQADVEVTVEDSSDDEELI